MKTERKRNNKINAVVYICLGLMLLTWGMRSPVFSQELSGRFLTFIPEGTIFRLGSYHGWGVGPGATFNFKLKKKLGGQVSFSYLGTSLGGYEQRTLTLDVGLWKPLKVKKTKLLAIGSGVTFFRGDYSEARWLTGFALHVTGHVYLWFSKPVGLYFRPAMRLWLYRGIYFKSTSNSFNVSLSAGLAFRI